MLISRLIKYYIELCAFKPKGRFSLTPRERGHGSECEKPLAKEAKNLDSSQGVEAERERQRWKPFDQGSLRLRAPCLSLPFFPASLPTGRTE